MNNTELKVGIGDVKFGTSPDKIITIGLGSCIGVVFYDSVLKIGALLHIMLPYVNDFNDNSNLYKYADSGVIKVVRDLQLKGVDIRRLTAKIAGGASMFNFSDASIISNIGHRNGLAVKETLKKFNIPITGEDTGGKQGRTMTLDTSTGIVEVKIISCGIKQI